MHSLKSLTQMWINLNMKMKKWGHNSESGVAGFYMTIAETSLVLVAVMNNPRDLEIARCWAGTGFPCALHQRWSPLIILHFIRPHLSEMKSGASNLLRSLRSWAHNSGWVIQDEQDHPRQRMNISKFSSSGREAASSHLNKEMAQDYILLYNRRIFTPSPNN